VHRRLHGSGGGGGGGGGSGDGSVNQQRC